jgi:hypothetical protein
MVTVVMRMNGAAMPVHNHGHQPSGLSLEDPASRLLFRRPRFWFARSATITGRVFQDYLWRWDIEVNFRDEKTILHVGQARSVARNSRRMARFGCGGYAMFLLAATQTYGLSESARQETSTQVVSSVVPNSERPQTN